MGTNPRFESEGGSLFSDSLEIRLQASSAELILFFRGTREKHQSSSTLYSVFTYSLFPQFTQTQYT